MPLALRRVALPCLLIAAGSFAACQPDHHEARLQDGAGLSEGAPVLVRGVRVGTLSDVRVEADGVWLRFRIDAKHDIELGEDACVVPIVLADEPTLVVIASDDGGAAPSPLQPCELDADELGELAEDLGETVGELLHRFGDGFLDGLDLPELQRRFGPLTPPVVPKPRSIEPPSVPKPRSIQPPSIQPPSIQPPSVQPHRGPIAPTVPFGPVPVTDAASACNDLHAELVSIERVSSPLAGSSAPLYRLTLRWTNGGDRAVTLPASTDATWLTADGQAHGTVLGGLSFDPQSWFMPFDVPAHASREVAIAVAIPGEPAIVGYEVAGVTPADQPFDRCTVAQRPAP